MQRLQNRMPKKKKTKNIMLYCIVITILFAIACISGQFRAQQVGDFGLADAELQVHVMDVGQADSILVIADGEAMLIDAAESGNGTKICNYLQKYGISELKYAVATHAHADHIGGFPTVLEKIKTENVLEPVCADELVPTTKTYENFLDAVEQSGASYKAVQAGETFTLGSAEITVLGPVSEETDDLNNTSVVLRLEYDGVSCLFTGDMEEPEEEAILAGGAELNADFLKVGHHGAATSSGERFLAAVTPQFAAISCGADNSYGHPAESTLGRLEKYTEEIHITAEEGDVVFMYDKDSGTCNFVTDSAE